MHRTKYTCCRCIRQGSYPTKVSLLQRGRWKGMIMDPRGEWVKRDICHGICLNMLTPVDIKCQRINSYIERSQAWFTILTSFIPVPAIRPHQKEAIFYSAHRHHFNGSIDYPSLLHTSMSKATKTNDPINWIICNTTLQTIASSRTHSYPSLAAYGIYFIEHIRSIRHHVS